MELIVGCHIDPIEWSGAKLMGRLSQTSPDLLGGTDRKSKKGTRAMRYMSKSESCKHLVRLKQKGSACQFIAILSQSVD